MTVTLSRPPRSRASSSRVWAASGGWSCAPKIRAIDVVVDHVGQAVAAKQQAVAVG